MKENKYYMPCRACKQFVTSMENMKLAKETNYGIEWQNHTQQNKHTLIDFSEHDLRENSYCIIIQHRAMSEANKELQNTIAKK